MYQKAAIFIVSYCTLVTSFASFAQAQNSFGLSHIAVLHSPESLTVGDPMFITLKFTGTPVEAVWIPGIVPGKNFSVEAILAGQSGSYRRTITETAIDNRCLADDRLLSRTMGPGDTQFRSFLFDPWSPELVDFIESNGSVSIDFRITLTGDCLWTVASYRPYRLQLRISGTVLPTEDLQRLNNTTLFPPEIPADIVEKLAQHAPQSTLNRNLQLSRRLNRLLDGPLPDDDVGPEILQLLDSTPKDLRQWYEDKVFSIVREKRFHLYEKLAPKAHFSESVE